MTREKDGFIDRSVPFPTDERLQQHWCRCNKLVWTWIGNCLAPEVAVGLPPIEDSKTIWDVIREMYGKLDRAKLFLLAQAVSDLKQGNQSVTTCFNRLSALWNELEAAEERLEGPEETISGRKCLQWSHHHRLGGSTSWRSKRRARGWQRLGTHEPEMEWHSLLSDLACQRPGALHQHSPFLDLVSR